MDRRQQLESLFHGALERPPAERDAWLQQACGNDSGLLREVRSLVAQHREQDSDAWAAAAAVQMIDGRGCLEAGARLGAYEILEPIGAGGMGEVYRARDTRLRRDVAIKVLPDAFAQDTDRLARFTREAQVLAALNHPNIAAVYGVEERAIVMELVEGKALAGPVSIDMALDYARQIAEALEYAHEKGIVHRDLKPANIKVTPEDRVKVLDFGLAKALEKDGGQGGIASSSTVTMNGTVAGVIMGTAAYMSPEQARGAAVDKRSDIWAFGALLYEMLAGRQAFAEETLSETLAAVLKTDADWSALPAETPVRIRKLLRRCLERDRRQRLQDIAEARIAIDAPEDQAGQLAAPATYQARWRQILPWALALLTVTAIALWERLHTPAPVPRPVMRWTMTLPNVGQSAGVTLSRDGSHLAYLGTSSGASQILVRSTDQLETKPIPGTENRGFVGHFFSPDGRWIGYWVPGSGLLKKVPVNGGAPVTLCETKAFHGASWGLDDTIVFGDGNGGLSRVPAAGGNPQVLATPDPKKGETVYAYPYLLPGGKALLFTIHAGRMPEKPRIIAVLNLRTGEKRVLLEDGAHPRYAPTGHLIYARVGSVFAVPFDADQLQVKGSPVPVLEGVWWIPAIDYADFSFSDSGTLVYQPGAVQEERRTMVWVDRKGTATPLAAPPQAYSNPSLSPDGRQIAVSIAGETQYTYDIWIYEPARGALTRATAGGMNFAPVWTPDGKRIAFQCRDQGGIPGISWLAADRSGPRERLLATESSATPGSWSPDGSALAFHQGYRGNSEIWLLPATGDVDAEKRKPRLLVPGNSWAPQVSPDGLWVAYASNESGTYQVYVQPFPGPGGKTQISTDSGNSPRWARNGRELFYRSGDKMMAVEIQTKPAFRAGRPALLFEGRYESSPPYLQPGTGYDVSPDGKRFLMIKSGGEQPATIQLQVVQDWFEELKRKVPGGK